MSALPICQLCGARHAEGARECAGPVVLVSGGARVLRDIRLVSWGPVLWGYEALAAAGDEAR